MNARLETFCDGVFAIAITLLILDVKVPQVEAVDKTSARFQLANGYLLFTVILMPFFTAFMADYLNTPYAQPAIVCFCLNTALHNTGWIALHRSILKAEPPLVRDAKALDASRKAYRGALYGLALYTAIGVSAWWAPHVALSITVLSWIYWLYVSLAVRNPEPA